MRVTPLATTESLSRSVPVAWGVVYGAHDERLNRNADISGLDRTYIGGIERGERNVSLVNIERIAKALKISIPKLFKSV
jgi:hypothetical protein